MGPMDTILKGDHPSTIPTKFGPHWSGCFKQEDFSLFFPYGPMLKLCPLMAAILDGHRIQRMQF